MEHDSTLLPPPPPAPASGDGIGLSVGPDSDPLRPESLLARWTHLAASAWHSAAPYVTTPVLVLFLLPLLMFSLIYFSGVLLYFYHRGERVVKSLRQAYEEQDIYRASREIVATFWDVQGWIWFGYEVQGLDNIPDEGPAMVIYYHGALPVDYYYLVVKVSGQSTYMFKTFTLLGRSIVFYLFNRWFNGSKSLLQYFPSMAACFNCPLEQSPNLMCIPFLSQIIQHKQRVMHSVVDRFLFQIWGLRTFLKAFYCTPGSQESCAEELEAGNLLGLAPGGVYEAQFGDERYEILWKERVSSDS